MKTYFVLNHKFTDKSHHYSSKLSFFLLLFLRNIRINIMYADVLYLYSQYTVYLLYQCNLFDIYKPRLYGTDVPLSQLLKYCCDSKQRKHNCLTSLSPYCSFAHNPAQQKLSSLEIINILEVFLESSHDRQKGSPNLGNPRCL